MANVSGNNNNNTIDASDGVTEGADSILGLDGNDTIFGLAGNDTVFGGADNDSVFGGFGNDSLFGETGSDRLFGGADNDYLSGGDSADSLFGGSGRDTLSGGAGGDSIVGGAGFDLADYSAAAGPVTVNLADTLAESGSDAAGDTLNGIEGIIGSASADSLVGNSSANEIYGGGGIDTISGGYGSDLIFGGDGGDVIDAGPDTPPVITPPSASFQRLDWDAQPGDAGSSYEAGFTQTAGGVVNVTVSYSESASSSRFVEDTGPVPGGADDIPIYAPNNEMPGGREFDQNSAGVLYRTGGAGLSEATIDFSGVPGSGLTDEVQDVYFRISDIDRGAFRDVVTVYAYDALGNAIPVTISENSSGLTVSGNTVTATTTNTGASPDDEYGSALFYIQGPVASIVIQYGDLANGQQAILISDVHFTTIPATVDSADDDTVYGGLGDDAIQAGIGDDSLFGEEGNDTLLGEAGNDFIDGGVGNDSIDGGDGDDSIVFGAGDDTVLGGDGNDFIDDNVGGQEAGANLLSGGAGNDTIWAGDGADSIYGDAGNDVANGEAGADSIYGGTGNDSISGGDGEDYINAGDDRDLVYGDADNDTIIGGAGTDSLYGGTGNDTFILNLGDTFNDTITPEIIDGGGTPGTSPGDEDVIDLTAYGWSRVDIAYTGGDPTSESGVITVFAPDGTTVIGIINFTEIEEVIPCFTPGTMILTDRGDVAVEALAVGDLVMTRDNGLQPLRWIGQRKLTALDLQADPDLQPVRIAKGAFSEAGPDRTMLVSPQHRVLIEGARAELLFGEAEVLVPAKHLIGHADVSRALPAEGVTYIHILFDRHEIVQSDGMWTESFQPAERMLSAMDADVRAEVLTLFPQLEQSGDAFEGARLSLKAHEARVLFAAE